MTPIVFSSSINAWHPTRMFNVGEFCKVMEHSFEQEDENQSPVRLPLDEEADSHRLKKNLTLTPRLGMEKHIS